MASQTLCFPWIDRPAPLQHFVPNLLPSLFFRPRFCVRWKANAVSVSLLPAGYETGCRRNMKRVPPNLHNPFQPIFLKQIPRVKVVRRSTYRYDRSFSKQSQFFMKPRIRAMLNCLHVGLRLAGVSEDDLRTLKILLVAPIAAARLDKTYFVY